MSDIAIQVENLSKRYLINHQRTGGGGLRHVLQDKLTAPFRWLGRSVNSAIQPSTLNSQPSATEEFWALKDVSFDIKQGEVVGIIGRNGAGKSTLLKILSRITEPTNGRITINGRVASLLEVGTGFHPDLTGRENIFLNGAILGMSRAEIKANFDAIVAFAEVERFLDTPVKRYSSGMYVRLAFSVAAHLEPEILVVDEVLAVGDAAFQQKCLGKMGEVSRLSGRTVLFVSHNMSAVQSLCSRVVVLNAGKMTFQGPVLDGISHYLTQSQNVQAAFAGDSVMKRLRIENDKQEEGGPFMAGGSITFTATLCPPRKISHALFGYGILNIHGERITTLHTEFQFPKALSLDKETTISVRWSNCNLCPGTYKVMSALYDGAEKVMVWDPIATLTIEPSDYFGTGKLPETGPQGWFLADAEWQVETPAPPPHPPKRTPAVSLTEQS